MANEVDRRVVEMQFENAQFERGVGQSLSTIEKLKSSLNFKDTAKGLSEIQNAGNRLSFNGLIAGLDAVTGKFSIWEVAAITAIQNIANRVTNLGIHFAKSLSIDQITAGWDKFALKAQSVNTILGATKERGETIESVSNQLDKLNRYTDETSASFTDMTANIGKFVNAGVGLSDAAQAMQGITNWAYLSGSTINEAGRAMYNLSQAMAVGSVKLMDWKSIENANMATVKFKETAIDTAVAMGTLVKTSEEGVYHVKGFNNAVVTATNFNSELSRGWFSADVLTATLDKFGDFSTDIINLADESGMTVTELMRHYAEFEDGSVDLGSVFAATGENAGELAHQFRVMGTASESIAKRLVKQKNAAKGLDVTEEELAKQTEQAKMRLDSLFLNRDDYSETNLVDIAETLGVKLSDLNELTKEMEENQSLGVAAFRAAQEYRSLRDAVDATVDAVSTGWMKTFELIFGNAEEAKQVWGAIGDLLYEVFASGAEERNKMLLSWHNNGGYEAFVAAIQNLSDGLIGLKELTNEIFKDSFLHIWKEDSDALVSLTEKFRDFTLLVKAATTGDFSEITGLTTDLSKIDKDLANTDISETLGSSKVDKVRAAYEFLSTTLDGVAHAFDIIKSVVEGVFTALEPVFDIGKTVGADIISLIEAIARRIADFNAEDSQTNGILQFFTNIRDAIEPVAQFISNVLHTLITGITDIIDPDTTSGLSTLGEVFANTFGIIADACKRIFPVISSIVGVLQTTFKSIIDQIKIFLEDKSLSEIMDLMKQGFGVAIAGGIASIVNSLKKPIGAFGKGGLIKTLMGTLFGFGGGGGGDSGAPSNPTGLKGFLGSIADTISEFADSLSQSLKKLVDVQALKTFATALLMLAGALFVMSLIPGEKLMSSFNYLAAGMGAMFLMMNQLGKMDAKAVAKMMAASVAMAAMSGAILILSAAMLVLSLIPAEGIENAVGALFGMLATITIALSVLSKMDPGKLIAAAAAMLIASPAILAMAIALGVLALIPADRMDSALKGLTGVLFEVAGALALLTIINPGKLLAAAAALLIVSPALLIFAAALGVLSLIPAENIEKALGALGMVLLEVVGALALLSAVGPMALVSSAALLILAPAILVLVAALGLLALIPSEALAANLIILALALTGFIAAAWLIAPVVGPLFAVIGALAAFGVAAGIAGIGMVGLSAGITALAIAIISVVQTVLVMANAIVSLIKIVGAGAEAIGTSLITGIINGLVAGVTALIKGAFSIGKVLIDTVKDVLDSHSPSRVFAGIGLDTISGLVNGVDGGLPFVESAGGDMANSLVGGFNSEASGLDFDFNSLLGQFTQFGYDSGGAFGNSVTQSAQQGIQDFNSMLLANMGTDGTMDSSVMEEYGAQYGAKFPEAATESFEGGMIEFDDLLAQFNSGITDIDYSNIDGLSVSLDGLNASMSSLDQEGMASLTESMTNLVTVTDDSMTQVVEKLDGSIPVFSENGSLMVSNLASGISSNREEAIGSVTFIVDGIINGITSLLPRVFAQGQEIGSTLVSGARSALDINSPSKQFAEIGRYSVLGLINSVTEKLQSVRLTGASIGEALLSSTEESLIGFDALMNDHVVSPVVDLSKSEIGSIDSNGNLSLGNLPYGLRSNLNGSQVTNNSPVFNIYQQPGQDPESLARIINRELGRMYVR